MEPANRLEGEISNGLAGGQGFEPRYRGPEPRVLPLHHPPVQGG